MNAGVRRAGLAALLIGVAAIAVGLRALRGADAARAAPAAVAPPGPRLASRLDEPFAEPRLATPRWAIVAEGDFQEQKVDVVERAGPAPADYRLRLRAATRGTRDDTVKFLGVRSVDRYALGPSANLSAELDWNNQANGCYLSGAVVLAPAEIQGNPLTGPDWLKVEYIGVPPGKNGRVVVALRSGGREQLLFTDGWPEVRREGRALSIQKVEIVLKGGSFEIRENGRLLYESKQIRLPFDSGHLYLLLSSHSNYPARELFFDNVRLSPE